MGTFTRKLVSAVISNYPNPEITMGTIQGLKNSKRIDKAIELLVFYNLTLIEIAYQLNYRNVEEFIIHFKKIVGLSPEQYKKLHPWHKFS